MNKKELNSTPKLEFLLIGRNIGILSILERLVNAYDDWHAVGFSEESLAKDYFTEHRLDFVMLSSGIDADMEKRLRAFFADLRLEVEIIQHYGGGSGLLRSEILEAIDKAGKKV